VSDEVRELHECLLSEQTRRLEQRVNWLGALIGVPAMVLSQLPDAILLPSGEKATEFTEPVCPLIGPKKRTIGYSP
jgi:hypothetical protein